MIDQRSIPRNLSTNNSYIPSQYERVALWMPLGWLPLQACNNRCHLSDNFSVFTVTFIASSPSGISAHLSEPIQVNCLTNPSKKDYTGDMIIHISCTAIATTHMHLFPQKIQILECSCNLMSCIEIAIDYIHNDLQLHREQKYSECH